MGRDVRATVASSTRRGVYRVFGGPGALRCDCSWGVGCKHVAAVLIAGLASAKATIPSVDDASRSDRANRGARSRPRASALALPSAVQAWLGQLHAAPATASTRLAFLLDLTPSGALVYVARQVPMGSGWTSPNRAHVNRVAKLPLESPPWDGVEWLDVLSNGGRSPTRIRGRAGHFVVTELARAGRLFMLGSPGDAPLCAGPALQGTLTWLSDGDSVRPAVALAQSGARALPTVPALYVDPERAMVGPIELGPVELAGPADQIARWLSGPALSTEIVPQVARALPPSLPPPKARPIRVVDEAPRGVLTLFEAPLSPGATTGDRYATVTFLYAGPSLHAPSSRAGPSRSRSTRPPSRTCSRPCRGRSLRGHGLRSSDVRRPRGACSADHTSLMSDRRSDSDIWQTIRCQ